MPNYAINPTPELDLRSNRALLPARVIAALDISINRSVTWVHCMSNPFLGPGAIRDIVKSKERTNSVQKREGLTEHPVSFTVCGCPDPNCGGWHRIETDRKVPSAEECTAILKADNLARKDAKLLSE